MPQRPCVIVYFGLCGHFFVLAMSICGQNWALSCFFFLFLVVLIDPEGVLPWWRSFGGGGCSNVYVLPTNAVWCRAGMSIFAHLSLLDSCVCVWFQLSPCFYGPLNSGSSVCFHDCCGPLSSLYANEYFTVSGGDSYCAYPTCLEEITWDLV